MGSFTTEVGVFVNVLEHTGKIQMHFAHDFGAGVLITGPSAQGWQHLHNSKAGWCGWQDSSIVGEGRMRVAIALLVPVLWEPLRRASVGGVRP